MTSPVIISENSSGSSSGMGGKKYMVLGIVTLVLAVGLFSLMKERRRLLFSEEFQNDLGWERECTRSDGDGGVVIPTAGNRFLSTEMTVENGMLHLYTGAVEHVGGGEWRRAVDVAVDAQTRAEWRWTTPGCEEYRLWIRIGFNNHRSIFYMASDSMPPGLYRGKRFVPYKGKKYRDGEGRSRFFPSATVLVGVPGDDWHTVRRSISDDYIKSYGGLPEAFKITEIAVGMMDDSRIAINEIGMAFLKIYTF